MRSGRRVGLADAKGQQSQAGERDRKYTTILLLSADLRQIRSLRLHHPPPYGTKKKMRTSRAPSPLNCAPGFTVVESLVVIAVLAVVMGIALPMLAEARSAGRGTGSLSNIRQIGIALQQYAVENADLPPVIFAPIESYDGQDDPETVEVGDRIDKGSWFDNAWAFHYALRPALPAGTLLSPGSVPHDIVDVGGVGTVNVADYKIPECLYADPDYWNRWTQTGPAQWRAQHLSAIAFPSDKGLVRQAFVYGLPGFPYEQQASDYRGVPSSVLWADLSGSTLVQATLNPGEPNFFFHNGKKTFLDHGCPIDETLMGVRGRDRGPYVPPTPPSKGNSSKHT